MVFLTLESQQRCLDSFIHSIRGENVTAICGPRSIGKTTFVKHVMDSESQSGAIVYTMIDCAYHCSRSEIYKFTLSSLREKLGIKSEDKMVRGTEGFFKSCRELDNQTKPKKKKEKYVVFDRADMLRNTDMVECIINIHFATNIKIILISSSPPSNIFDIGGDLSCKRFQYKDLNIINMRELTKQDLITLICLDLPDGRNGAEFYKDLATNAVTLSYDHRSKNLDELKLLCEDAFEEFSSTHDDGKGKTRSRKESISHSMTKFIKTFGDRFQKKATEVDELYKRSDERLTIGSALMIIAAYIAAYTSPACDKVNFVKFQRKRISAKVRDDPTSGSFPMERLIQIHIGLTKLAYQTERLQEHHLPDSMLGYIQLLKDVNYIYLKSGDGLDSNSRFGLSESITRDYVDNLARIVELDLGEIHGL